ncbi:MAG: HAD-IIB family hydrolase [Candidatus Brocadiales bacterium]
MMNGQQCYIIFSDLDGTLLNHDSYSWEEARPALAVIRERGIPLVLCSSKTKSEIEQYRLRLRNEHPFISENGGGIFIPIGYRGFRLQYDLIQEGYWVICLSVGYPSLVKALGEIKEKTGLKIKGFSDMNDKEVAMATGLGLEEARLAKKRQFDEPFLVEGETDGLREAIKAMGLECTEGGRFFHLMGNIDKGKATRRLADMYRENCPDFNIVTVGIGDSLNDLPMLEAVDIAILVKGPYGGYDHRVVVKDLIRTEDIGPKGWNDAVLRLIT